MNKEEIVTNIIVFILNLVVFILATIGVFNDSEVFSCTWYDVMLVLMILGQQLKIRMLVKEYETRDKDE